MSLYSQAELAANESDPGSQAIGFIKTLVRSTTGPLPSFDDDALLIAKCRSGDLGSYALLIDRHEQRVRSIVTRILSTASDSKSLPLQSADVDDLSQEIFVQAWKALPRFRGEARFSTWLYRIAVNRALKEYNYRRKGTGRTLGVPVSDDLLRHLASVHPDPNVPDVDPESIVQQMARDSALRDAIHQLPEKQRVVVILHYFEDCSCEEIAAIAGCNVGTVWSRLHYACRRLQERLSWMEPGVVS